MPRYFFDITDNGLVARDDEGLELPDLQSVKAARSLADMAKHAVWTQAGAIKDHRMSVEVRDEHGAVLQAKFTFELDCPS